ncbi:BCP1 family protein, partial [Kipferlia bialata]
VATGANGANPGLIVTGRFVSLPLPLLPGIYQSTDQDCQWAEQEIPGFSPFTHLIHVSMISPVEEADGAPATNPNKRGQSDMVCGIPVSQTAFFRPEDLPLLEMADLAFSFKIPNPEGPQHQSGTGPRGLVLVVPGTAMGALAQKLSMQLAGM